MQYGSSAGKAAALMKAVVANLTEDDIIAISAYVASLPPR
jgi:cytochrome c553